MTNKERYRILCAEGHLIPLYSQDWWLDCVCGPDKWDVLLYMRKEHVEAAMPYYRLPGQVLSMPPFTQTLGIWFNPLFESKKKAHNIRRKQAVCTWFIENLPPHRVHIQCYDPSLTDWLPFYWKGYKQTTRYNYFLPDLSDPEELLQEINENSRRNIRKAREKYRLVVKENIPEEVFMGLYGKTFAKQKMKSYEPASLLRIIRCVRDRKQGDLFGVCNEQGEVYGAMLLVRQGDCTYSLAGGSDAAYRDTGAYPLLMWEAIRLASTVSKSFSFEGSMLPGVGRLFNEFGGIQEPYFLITKNDSLFTRKLISFLLRGRKR